jgi:hypothetical protein
MTHAKLVELIDCTQRIIDLVGPCSLDDGKILPTNNVPTLPAFTLSDLVSSTTYRSLPPLHCSKMERLVQQSLSATRQNVLRRFHDVIAQTHSTQQYGLQDRDVETLLSRNFEESYARCVQRLRVMLMQPLPGRGRCGTEGRGGFGDVSPPLLTRANKFSKPSES